MFLKHSILYIANYFIIFFFMYFCIYTICIYFVCVCQTRQIAASGLNLTFDPVCVFSFLPF